MKHLFLLLICMQIFAFLGEAFAQSEVEKILQEAKTLGEEGLRTKNFKKLQEARTKALSVANQDKTAYTIVGDLYFNSYQMCRAGDAINSRGAFLIAYDMYAKANDTENMNKARQQFPSVTDAFVSGMKESTEIKVECWIKEKTTLKLRPKQ